MSESELQKLFSECKDAVRRREALGSIGQKIHEVNTREIVYEIRPGTYIDRGRTIIYRQEDGTR